MKTTQLRASAVIALTILAFVTPPSGVRPINAAAAPSLVTITTAYTTGYTWFDNSPPGNDICCGVIHRAAGGTGTYADPITLAAGLVSSGVLDYPAGTRFYMPDVRRYFIVEDSCGNVGSGGCHFLNKAPAGATTWVDRWVGGTASDSQAAVQDCANYLTDEGGGTPLHTIVEGPPAGLPVVSGPLFQNGQCTAVYGNGLPPASTPPPAPIIPPTVAPVQTPAQTPTPAPSAPVGGATPSPSVGPTGPSPTPVPTNVAARPRRSIAPGVLAGTVLALLLVIGGIAGWLRWRRSRPRGRGPHSR
jgi:hypothetical protein